MYKHFSLFSVLTLTILTNWSLCISLNVYQGERGNFLTANPQTMYGLNESYNFWLEGGKMLKVQQITINDSPASMLYLEWVPDSEFILVDKKVDSEVVEKGDLVYFFDDASWNDSLKIPLYATSDLDFKNVYESQNFNSSRDMEEFVNETIKKDADFAAKFPTINFNCAAMAEYDEDIDLSTWKKAEYSNSELKKEFNMEDFMSPDQGYVDLSEVKDSIEQKIKNVKNVYDELQNILASNGAEDKFDPLKDLIEGYLNQMSDFILKHPKKYYQNYQKNKKNAQLTVLSPLFKTNRNLIFTLVENGTTLQEISKHRDQDLVNLYENTMISATKPLIFSSQFPMVFDITSGLKKTCSELVQKFKQSVKGLSNFDKFMNFLYNIDLSISEILILDLVKPSNDQMINFKNQMQDYIGKTREHAHGFRFISDETKIDVKMLAGVFKYNPHLDLNLITFSETVGFLENRRRILI